MKQDIKYVSIGKYKQLEEENKKLNERIKELEGCNLNLQEWLDNKEKVNKSLREENKKLKDKIEHLEFDIEAWKGLKAVWEKKEQELQRENEKLNLHIEAKDKAYMDLLADYNYLKARIKKTERAFIKYKEKLEKLEVDLDMVVMNR